MMSKSQWPSSRCCPEPLVGVEAVHLRLHLRPSRVDEGDLRPRDRRVQQLLVAVHEALAADDGPVVILRRDVAALLLVEARWSRVKGQRRAVMGHRLGGPDAPAPVVVLVDDEGPAAAGGVHEPGGQPHVGQVALGEGADRLGRPLAVPQIVLAPGPQLPRQQGPLVVGPEVVLVVPLRQQQIGFERPPELDEDLVEGLLALEGRALGEEELQAGGQLRRAIRPRGEHVGHLLEVGESVDRPHLFFRQPRAQVAARIVAAMPAVAQGFVVVGGVEAVEPEGDPLAHHRLEDGQPLRVAHAAPIGAVGTARYGAPPQGAVSITLRHLLGGSARRRAQQIVGPHARPVPAEETDPLLVIPEVHRRRQLPRHPGPGLLDPGNDLRRQVETRFHAAQRHPRPRRRDTLVPGQRVKVGPEVPHLHQLDPPPAHMIQHLGRPRQGPVLDDAAHSARLGHFHVFVMITPSTAGHQAGVSTGRVAPEVPSAQTPVRRHPVQQENVCRFCNQGGRCRRRRPRRCGALRRAGVTNHPHPEGPETRAKRGARQPHEPTPSR